MWDKYVPFIIHIASSVPALLGKLWKEAILLYIQPTEDKHHLGIINMQPKKQLAQNIAALLGYDTQCNSTNPSKSSSGTNIHMAQKTKALDRFLTLLKACLKYLNGSKR